ncbi:peptidyl-prolyl cis-trans isomerase FKBP43-like [Coffea eugenioides]|uniref:peptidyl-prolyl cis-trans isomerase FKBP43-like n=1 Tax=Coffea eugenioides TaxID=49369 RepID=UPI000F60C0A2|nr:peptidyl-prolyl cis-trans isomerase FKBP43-like [Coffea eugenioides]
MAFWGIEVKPGKPVTHSFDKVRRRLRISQATLGIGSAITKSLVQCNVGNKSPVFLCALLPDKTESCHLDLEFEEADDVVFSVIGPRSVYLTGYYVSNDQHPALNSDTESYGEDIANTETEESGLRSDEDEYEDSFIDDSDPVLSPPSPDGVVKEMDDVKEMRERKGSKRLQGKKFVIIDSDDETTSQESEDDDNHLISASKNNMVAKDKVTVETIAEPADCGASGHESKEKADPVTMPKEPKRKTLPCNASFPADEVKLDKEMEPKEIRCLSQEAETFEDNSVNPIDSPVHQVHANLAKVDDASGSLHASKKEDKSELAPVNNKKSKRKRKEQADGDKIIEGSNSNHKKSLKEDKVMQAVAETDNKEQDLPMPNESNQEPTINGKIDLDGPSSLPHPEKDQPSKKRRKKGSIKERSDGSNDATSKRILVDDQLKENLLKDEKIVSDMPATTSEDKKQTADEGTNFDFAAEGNQLEKPKKKKKKAKTVDNKENMNVSGSLLSENESREPSKSCQVRTLSNGLVIEELALGEQEGKIAAIGKKVKVYYTGMLKESGHVFDSNVGNSPYKFRLGDEAIIGGWNIGLEGMHVGDKRRLIIPPALGYGSKGAGENVPPNSWLVYDVELAGVR